MKALIAFLILLGAGGYVIMKLRDENILLKQQVAALSEQLSIAGLSPDGQSAPAAGHKRIACPACNGTGTMTARGGGGKATPPGPRRCPICLGSGKREFDLPPGEDICPDCKGMGRRLAVPGTGSGLQVSSLDQTATSTTCQRCLGKGYNKRAAK